jgi:hypothetical protein
VTQIVRQSTVLKPLDEDLSPEVRAWASEVRELFAASGLSIGRFVALCPNIDKGTVSRYLNGRRVPRDRWFLDKLVSIQADAGRPVTPAVHEHLNDLQLRALEVAHPHEYRVRLVKDELEVALTSLREAQRYARALEEQLAERKRQVEELSAEKQRLRSAWDDVRASREAERERLIEEIADLEQRLDQAQQRTLDAEERCRRLEGILDHLQLTGRDQHLPAVWGRVPHRSKNFTGREEVLEELRASITDSTAAVVRQPYALLGPAGSGKTFLAVEYAHRYGQEYDLVWWIPMDQPLLFRSTMAQLAPSLNVPPATETGIDECAAAVLDALRRGEPYDRWLLIFDNADGPEDLLDLLPHAPGHVLVTSRNRRWASQVETVTVEMFDRAESLAFLRRRTNGSIPEADADRLAEELGDLPLALEQAGALLFELGMSVSEYLGLLAERPSRLLSHGRPTEYPVPLTAAFTISMSTLSEELPEAVALLRLCAVLGTGPIPRDLLRQAPSGLGEELAGLINDPIRLSWAVGALSDRGLARIDVSRRTIEVHRLVQKLVCEELSPDERDGFEQAASLLLAAYGPAAPGQIGDDAVPDAS